MKLIDAAVGQVVFYRERFDDGAGTVEVRETYLRRMPGAVGGGALRARLGLIQGVPGDYPPRFVRLLDAPCIDPASSPVALPVFDVSESVFGCVHRFFEEE